MSHFPPGYCARDAEFDDGYDRYTPGREPPEGCTQSFLAGWRAAQAEDEQGVGEA